MEEEVSEIVVGIIAVVAGLIGLVMASGALDDEIFLFGISLAAFAVLFIFSRVKRHFDRREEAKTRV